MHLGAPAATDRRMRPVDRCEVSDDSEEDYAEQQETSRLTGTVKKCKNHGRSSPAEMAGVWANRRFVVPMLPSRQAETAPDDTTPKDRISGREDISVFSAAVSFSGIAHHQVDVMPIAIALRQKLAGMLSTRKNLLQVINLHHVLIEYVLLAKS